MNCLKQPFTEIPNQNTATQHDRKGIYAQHETYLIETQNTSNTTGFKIPFVPRRAAQGSWGIR
jgi:hypothetical protein